MSSKLAYLFLENTGRHMLDSGGAYGRNWERQQDGLTMFVLSMLTDGEYGSLRSWYWRGEHYTIEEVSRMRMGTLLEFGSAMLDMAQDDIVVAYMNSKPYSSINFDMYRTDDNGYSNQWYLEYTINTYHWLKERIDHSPEMEQFFRDYCSAMGWEYNDFSWTGDYEMWFNHMDSLMEETGKFHAIDIRERWSENTYNGDSLLSQVLQYEQFDFDAPDVIVVNGVEIETPSSGAYILLQIHGGCDVRGGYTPVEFFVSNGNYEYPLFDTSYAYLPGWFTDDGYHWYYANDYHITLNQYSASENVRDRGNGYVYIDEHGRGYCPITGVELA